jgi:hypothetical protein
MKLIQLLKEAYQSPQDAIEYLKSIASTGEFDKQAIDNLHRELLSSRRKMFANRKSPDQRSASSQKGQLTRQLNKIKDKAQEEAEIELGLLIPGESTPIEKAAMGIRLAMGNGPKNLQQKYSRIVINKIEKAAREAGITDQEAIKNAYYYQDPT